MCNIFSYYIASFIVDIYLLLAGTESDYVYDLYYTKDSNECGAPQI